MRNNTPSPRRLRPAFHTNHRISWQSVFAGLMLAGLLASFSAADTVVDDDSDTLRTGARAVLSRDDVRIEVHTDRDGRRSSITIHGDAEGTAGSHGAVRSSEIVRIGESVTVQENQIVDGDVVAVLGDVTVYGRVKGNVVSVMGTIFIRNSGVVDGDAVGIGGGVRKDPGARLGGENVAIRIIPGGFFGAGSPMLIGPLFGASAIVFSMLLLFLIGWLVLALGESHVRRVGTQVQEHLWKSLFTGLAAIILSPFAFILLLVTVVGIPLALLLPVVFPLAQLVGFVIVAGVVGMRLIGRNGATRSDLTYGLAVGLLFFLGIMLIGQVAHIGPGMLRFFGIILTVFGIAATFVAATIGLGALVLSRFGMGPRKTRPEESRVMPPGSPAGTHPLATT